MACLRLLILAPFPGPGLPDFRVPFLNLRMTCDTFFCALVFLANFAMPLSEVAGNLGKDPNVTSGAR